MIGNLAVGIQDFVIPAPQGDFDSIATVAVGSGGANAVEFTSIPTTYKHLQIRGIAQDNRATYNTSALEMTVNGVTSSVYSWHYLQADWTAGSTSAQSSAGSTQTTLSWCAQITSTVASDIYGVFVMDILDYADTSKYTTLRSLSGGDANAEVAGFRPVPRLWSGLYQQTTAVTSLKFVSSFGSTISQYSHFALYGIKG